jgi:dipeptidyl-peptidase-3
LPANRPAAALKALIQWYRTGDDGDRAKYDIAWVKDKDAPVDTINGFIEVYMDPRGLKGSWEGVVFHVNKEKTDRIKKFATNAQWFEDHMPYDAKYRKPTVTGIVANAIDVVIETGDSGTGDADRHQPAERSEHSRAVRQQVGVAGQRE